MRKGQVSDGMVLNQKGISLQEAGRLNEAEVFFRKALSVSPDLASAHCNLGGLLCALGRTDEGLVELEKALELDPLSEAALNNYASALEQLGRITTASTVLEKAHGLYPTSTLVSFSYARILIIEKRFPQAHKLLEELVRVEPSNGEALHGLGLACMGLDDVDGAHSALQKAVQVMPGNAIFWYDLGNACMDLSDWSGAASSYQHSLKLAPDYHGAILNLGIVLLELHDFSGSMKYIECALQQDSSDWQVWMALGKLHFSSGELEDALAAYNRAVALVPERWEPYNGLGVVLNEQLDLPAAVVAYRKAISLDGGDCPEVQWNLSLTLLALGEVVEGWEAYEMRWKRPGFPSPVRKFSKPLWEGSSGNLLLHSEQGLGDTLQFVRFAKLAKERCGGCVYLEVEVPLLRILDGVEGIDGVFAKGNPGESLPDFDCHLPLMSLPRVLGSTLNVPSSIPYLSASPEDCQAWRDRLATEDSACPLVGVVWEGNPENQKGRKRNVPWAVFEPFLDQLHESCTFFCLQPEKAGGDIPLGTGAFVRTFNKPPIDLAETAALIENLNLVVTVDTSVAHLSAAMGKKTWLLLCAAPDWRWLNGGNPDMWYPGIRIYRQEKLGEWSLPLEALMRDLLKELAGLQAV